MTLPEESRAMAAEVAQPRDADAPLTELLRALATLSEPPLPEHRRLAELLGLGPLPERDGWSDLFLFQLYPYASIYLGAEGMLGGEARDRVAGFWRALGESPPAEPDHLAVMLAFHARLGELEAAAGEPGLRGRLRHARRAFLWEHLLSWLPVWLEELSQLAPPFYRRWGELLARTLEEEARELAGPEALPLALRQAPPGLADPRAEGGEAFLASLLAPVRSGFLLVRDDLMRAGRELELGVRAGERRFVLEALLSQDAAAVLGWLGREAAGRAERHRCRGGPGAAITAFWAARAETAAELLTELATEAAAAPDGGTPGHPPRRRP